MTNKCDDALKNLIEGYRQFRTHYVSEQYGAYRVWAGKTQTPEIMMISCSDSRVNPAILTHAGLGEVFMVNNVANLVPPYKEGKDTHHSTSSAVEYAVTVLNVRDIIILGHSGCGGIGALMSGADLSGGADRAEGAYSFIGPWVEIALKAKQRVLENYADCLPGEQNRHCEKEALLVSLENLKSFPWVSSAMERGRLNLYAWYFEIESGDLFQFNPDTNIFEPLLD